MISALTMNEIDAVFGGAGSVPTTSPAGTCPTGTTLTSATYNGAGQLTSVTCTTTSTTQSIQEKATLTDTVVSVAKAVWDAVTG